MIPNTPVKQITSDGVGFVKAGMSKFIAKSDIIKDAAKQARVSINEINMNEIHLTTDLPADLCGVWSQHPCFSKVVNLEKLAK